VYAFLWAIPGIGILYANFSEHFVCSIFIHANEDRTAGKFQNIGIYNSDFVELPKESIEHSENGESLKSRM
jgi:hypothetical protein